MIKTTTTIPSPRVFVVEDQAIVSEDLVSRLRGLGYDVAGTARTADESVRQVCDLAPDVVLMDVRLDGAKDGIDAAANIQERVSVPIVYLTGHGDDATFARASETMPFGYILKPFEEHQLRMAIELALRQHRLQGNLDQARHWLATTLDSIADGVIATGPGGSVMFVNREAERILGIVECDVRGKDVDAVLPPSEEADDAPLAAVMRGVVKDAVSSGHPTMVPVAFKHGRILVEGTASPIFDDNRQVSGCITVFRDVTAQRRIEQEREQLLTDLQEAISKVDVMRGLLPICSWCRRIRNDQGYWHSLEDFLTEHSEARPTHGICPECAEKLYVDHGENGE